ncbi:MAG: tetratricopeptide repeat protein [Fimbriimonadales bacterium]
MTPGEQYEIGYTHRCEGNYALAREAFEAVLASSPGHPKARWQLALIMGFEGDFDGSLAALRELSEQAPGDTEIRYDYAMTLNMLGFFDEACAEFRSVLLIDPDHERANQQLAYCT